MAAKLFFSVSSVRPEKRRTICLQDKVYPTSKKYPPRLHSFNPNPYLCRPFTNNGCGDLLSDEPGPGLILKSEKNK